MITKLTDEQKDALEPYAKKWIDIGLRTGDTDWETFDKYMPICYQKAGLEYPKTVIRVSSPLEGALLASKKEAEISGEKPKWHYWIGGQFWVGYYWGGVAYCNYFFDVCGLKLSKDIMERAEAYRKVSESVNYIWCNSEFVIVCERPSEIHRNDQGQLHNEEGMSIKYPNGWGLYSIDGVTVNEKIVMNPSTITLDEIKSEKNQEKQRIMIQRYGVDKYLTAIEAKVIDTDFRGIEGGGARCLMREPNGNQWLCATDGSTDRIYHLFVPNNVNTCKDAHESLCGFKETRIKMEG